MSTMMRFYRDVLGSEIQVHPDTIHVYLIKDDTVFMFYLRSEFEKFASREFGYVILESMVILKLLWQLKIMLQLIKCTRI